MFWFHYSAVKKFQIRHLRKFQTGHFVIRINVKRITLINIADLTLMKHDSDSQQTLVSEQTKWSKRCHNASCVSVMLLRQQLSKTKCRNNERRQGSAYYSYSACFQHYYSAQYENTIQPTILNE